MKNNPSLYKLFRKYNRLYFDGLLPDICLYYEDLEDSGVLGECEPWNYTISIHNNLTPFQLRSVLAHEMVHCFEYLVEDVSYETEDEYHTISFYWHAMRIYQLSGLEVA